MNFKNRVVTAALSTVIVVGSLAGPAIAAGQSDASVGVGTSVLQGARPTSPRIAAMKPEGIQAHFNDEGRHGVLVMWDLIGGDGGTVQYNTIKLVPLNGCTCKTYTRQCNCIYIPYKDFPRRNSAFRIRITAHGWDGSASTGTTWLKAAVRRYKVSVRQQARATAFAQSCLQKGVSAAVTIAEGGGVVKAVSYFIPGAGEVKMATIAAGSISSGILKYVHCTTPW
ncbi:hypothetical protein [Nocardioides montaniterrae]